MANDSPERYVLNMAKNHRTGLLPRFHRARPGATVSMPLNWNQLRDGLDRRHPETRVPSLADQATRT
jgi:bifunctional non-homologous end joining protein LigD